jgi:hypothetical protein
MVLIHVFIETMYSWRVNGHSRYVFVFLCDFSKCHVNVVGAEDYGP